MQLPNGFPYLWSYPVVADAAAGLDPALVQQGNQFADDVLEHLGADLTREQRSFAWGIVTQVSGHTIGHSVMSLFDGHNKLLLLDFGMACFQASRLLEKR